MSKLRCKKNFFHLYYLKDYKIVLTVSKIFDGWENYYVQRHKVENYFYISQ